MPHYKVYNKDNDRELIHPKVGLWNTTKLEEALGMRDSFRAYLRQLGMSDMAECIVIRDIETNKDID